MDHSLSDTMHCPPFPTWCRGNASVIVEESSSGSAGNSSFAADGDLTTMWETSDSAHEWVTLDLGDAREITALRLQVHAVCSL